MPRVSRSNSLLLLASASILAAALPAQAGEALQRFAARGMPEAPPAPALAPVPAEPAAKATAEAPSPEQAAKVAALRAKEVWTAQCDRVGTLAGSGMGFCVVNAN